MAKINNVLNPALCAHLERSRVRDDLAMLATVPTVAEVCVYPDVEREPFGIGVPVGVAFRTEGHEALVIPNGVTDGNDGYRVMRLGVGLHELSPHLPDILNVLSELSQPTPTTRSQRDSLLRHGSASIAALEVGDPQNLVWRPGNQPEARTDDLTDKSLGILEATFGSFGGYGHFLEIVVVDHVYGGSFDPGEVLVILHGGAMQFGDEIYWRAYHDFAFESHAQEVVSEKQLMAGLFGLPITHHMTTAYLGQHAAVVNVAYAWRTVIQFNLQRLLSRTLKRAVAVTLISDIPHNRLELEQGGVLHAKGVQPLLRTEHEDPLPGVICLGFGTSALLFAPSAGAAAAGLGCNHGASKTNRLRKYPAADSADWLPTSFYSNHQRDLTGLRRRLAQQNVHDTLDTLLSRNIVKPLARLRPLINFVGAVKPDTVPVKGGKNLLR